MVEWVPFIDLDEERKAKTESCFSCNADFHYPKLIEKFEDLLEVLKVRK